MQVSRPKDNAAIAAALAALTEAIRLNRRGHALSAARALLVLAGPVKAIERIKRDGVLRAPSFAFFAPAIGALVAGWVEYAVAYGVSPAAITYLTSVDNL